MVYFLNSSTIYKYLNEYIILYVGINLSKINVYYDLLNMPTYSKQTFHLLKFFISENLFDNIRKFI